MSERTLYLCDPRRNATCKGTVCFYNGLFEHLCYLTPDAGCALVDAEGLPIALAEDGFMTEIRVDKLRDQPRRMDHVFEKGDGVDAETADAAGTAGDL